MATLVQKNLQEKNAEYAGSFTKGDLALPPAKKYTICKAKSTLLYIYITRARLIIP